MRPRRASLSAPRLTVEPWSRPIALPAPLRRRRQRSRPTRRIRCRCTRIPHPRCALRFRRDLSRAVPMVYGSARSADGAHDHPRRICTRGSGLHAIGSALSGRAIGPRPLNEGQSEHPTHLHRMTSRAFRCGKRFYASSVRTWGEGLDGAREGAQEGAAQPPPRFVGVGIPHPDGVARMRHVRAIAKRSVWAPSLRPQWPLALRPRARPSGNGVRIEFAARPHARRECAVRFLTFRPSWMSRSENRATRGRKNRVHLRTPEPTRSGGCLGASSSPSLALHCSTSPSVGTAQSGSSRSELRI